MEHYLLEAGDAYLATLPEPDTGPTMGEVLSWPEVIEAAQRAALARGYKPPGEARASHLRIVSSEWGTGMNTCGNNTAARAT